MIRLSMVGGAMSYHGRYFARLYNGANASAWSHHGLGGEADAGRRLKDARIVKVWDPNAEHAEQLAALCRIDEVCEDISECGREVDGILLPDDCTCQHYRFAEPLWSAGVPIFIDKPLAGTAAAAERVLEKAKKHGVKVFSASALQYAREIADAAEEIASLGNVLVAVVASPNELLFYGIHGLAMLRAVFGGGIASVRNVGEHEIDLVRYRWADGHLGVQVGLERGRPGWRMTLFGERGKLDITVSDADYFYWNLQQQFLDMIRTGVPPLADEDMLEIIRALDLAKKSKADGGVEIEL